MRVVLLLSVIALLASACGQTSTQSLASPTPERFGTATLTETNCDFAMPSALPMHPVSFGLVNKTKFTGHFGLLNINDDHTFQNLVDFWNGHGGLVPAPFATLITEQAVPANGSMELVATVSARGTYAFHCGFHDQDDKVTGFWHELKAG